MYNKSAFGLLEHGNIGIKLVELSSVGNGWISTENSILRGVTSKGHVFEPSCMDPLSKPVVTPLVVSWPLPPAER